MWISFVLISTLAWSLLNVLNSSLVHHYLKNPIAISWSQSWVTLFFLLLIGPQLHLATPWAPLLFLFGMTAYLADLWYFHVLHHLDISVANATWSILSLFLSIAGFVFFHESWTLIQTIGAFFIVGGALFLSLYHQQLSIKRTLWLLVSLAALYVPYYVFKKDALDAGLGMGTVLFWMIFGRDFFSFGIPLFMPSVRREVFTAARTSWHFSIATIVVVLLYLIAEYFGALAYASSGPLSLVAVVSNVQPFTVLGIAWLCATLWPSKAPRELLTRQSVSIKLGSFLIVFLGLALLTVSQ